MYTVFSSFEDRIVRPTLQFAARAVMWCVHKGRYAWLRFFGKNPAAHGVRVILVRDGKVALVRHWLLPEVWTLPGGGVSREEDLYDTAIREVREETGLRIWSFAGEVGRYHGKSKRDTVVVLVSEHFGGHLKFFPDWEIVERGFFPLDDLPPGISPANRRRVEAYKNGVRNEEGVW